MSGLTSQTGMAKKENKDLHAVHLGRLGGRARMKKLTPEKRSEIAKKAARARWAKARGKDEQSK